MSAHDTRKRSQGVQFGSITIPPFSGEDSFNHCDPPSAAPVAPPTRGWEPAHFGASPLDLHVQRKNIADFHLHRRGIIDFHLPVNGYGALDFYGSIRHHGHKPGFMDENASALECQCSFDVLLLPRILQFPSRSWHRLPQPVELNYDHPEECANNDSNSIDQLHFSQFSIGRQHQGGSFFLFGQIGLLLDYWRIIAARQHSGSELVCG